MTGFKSGASGDDPFGDESNDGEKEDDDILEEGSSSEIGTDPVVDTSDDRGAGLDENTGATSSSGSLPWIYQRDSITDGRSKTVQLHLQDSTLDRQREARTGVESVLGESVKKADLREAALLVGLERIDDVADQLREWGYDFE